MKFLNENITKSCCRWLCISMHIHVHRDNDLPATHTTNSACVPHVMQQCPAGLQVCCRLFISSLSLHFKSHPHCNTGHKQCIKIPPLIFLTTLLLGHSKQKYCVLFLFFFSEKSTVHMCIVFLDQNFPVIFCSTGQCFISNE